MKDLDGLLQKYKEKTDLSLKWENNRRRQNQTGRASEFLIASDLMRQGYDVYYAVSATNNFDLIVVINGELKTVEVKTRKRIESFRCMVRKNPDVLALVDYANNIKYMFKHAIARAEAP